MITNKQPAFSCEFFPPRTDAGRENWREALADLAQLKPAFFSCTYGAGGTVQSGTRETIREIIERGFPGAPHITCIGSTREKIRELLLEYRDLGVSRVVALRGDLPEGMTDPGEFRYADELVSFIRKETGDHFHVEIAAYPEKHPEAGSMSEDLANFKKKADAGANSAITQYFFNLDAYLRYVEDLQKIGVDLPIVPGIMPITNYKQLARFSAGCGAEIPRWILIRLEELNDDLDSIRAFGLEVVTRLCEQLLDNGAPGLHFYTLNRAEPTVTLWNNLGLSNRS
jgi:methylenetetrahydrofolate reductase (NADPH)